MPISVNWSAKVINIPKAYMEQIQSDPFEVRKLDLDQFRKDLRDLEDDEEGMPFLPTHTHNTEVVLSGATYARMIIFISGYTVTIEDGQYAVNAVGANSNLADVLNLNQVSLRSANSAGLITVTQGSGVTEQDKLDIADRCWNEARAIAVKAKTDGLPVDPARESTLTEIQGTGFVSEEDSLEEIQENIDEIKKEGVGSKSKAQFKV